MSDDRAQHAPHHTAAERLPTGITGLDVVLRGGVLRGGLYIVQGTPGAGKTVLANQICYRYAARGGRALYVTLLAENHVRMMQHLSGMQFFDAAFATDQITYVNGFAMLRSEGLIRLIALLRREIEIRKASLLVLDGFVAVQQQAGSENEFKTFVHELQVLMTLTDCTGFLLSTAGVGQAAAPEHTMVDGLFDLDNGQFGFRAERGLTVRKLRGSGFMAGRHAFDITEQGLTVYPRIEVLYGRPSRAERMPREKKSTGIENLDAVLRGGLLSGTITALVGPSGSGKTSLGLEFLRHCSATEPGLLFGFFEPPGGLCRKAAALNMDLESLVDAGDVELLWQTPTENIIDALGHKLLTAVDRRRVKRLLVDGLNGFVQAAIEPGRIGRFFASIAYELRSRGVTTLYTMEVQEVVSTTIQMPMQGISSLVDNLILLRFVEQRRQLRRLLSIVKVHDGEYDPMFREVVFTSEGITLVDAFAGAEDVLSGFAHPRGRSGGPA